MKDIRSFSIRVEDQVIYVLNQKTLPHKEEWISCHKPEDMIACIKELSVRGAPLIGVAASFLWHSMQSLVSLNKTSDQLPLLSVSQDPLL